MPDSGRYITRDELAAHIRRIDDNLTGLRADVDEIKDAVGAGGRWLGARMTVLFDRTLPLILASAAAFLLVRF